jgi:nucleoid DNA-binding protein
MSCKVPFSKLKTITKSLIIEQLEIKFKDIPFLLSHNSLLFNLLIMTIRSAIVIEKKHVMLKDLGTLKINYKKERKGIKNPKTRDEIVIPPHYAVTLNKSAKGERLITSEIIDNLSRKYACSTKDRVSIKKYVTEFIAIIRNIDKGLTRIEIRGFGVFYPTVHAARSNTLNPSDDKLIPELTFILFKASKRLNKEINSK